MIYTARLWLVMPFTENNFLPAMIDFYKKKKPPPAGATRHLK